MISKKLVFATSCIFLLELIPLHLAAQESYTIEALRHWTQALESERAPIEIISTCEPANGIVPICGIQNPEDLAVTPSENWVLFSERIPASDKSDSQGNIGVLRISDHKILRIYSPGTGRATKDSWGSRGCSQPPEIDEFTPLGMDLSLLKSNQLRLLVVNQASQRNSIEYFEISELADRVVATWRGCVRLPPGITANSVATVPAGGFVVSSYPTPETEEALNDNLERIVKGERFGNIKEWTPQNGWRDVPVGHASAPNGILVSEDSETIYFASGGTNEVVRIKKNDDPQRTTVLIPKVDNLRWSKEGKILAASGRGSTLSLFRDCSNLKSGGCGQEFAVVEIDPDTLTWKELIHHQGPPIGIVSSAIKIGKRLYMGTAFGDRMAFKDLIQ